MMKRVHMVAPNGGEVTYQVSDDPRSGLGSPEAVDAEVERLLGVAKNAGSTVTVEVIH